MSAFASQVLVRLDPRAREPLQAQLCASLRRAIRDGVLRPGTRLPSSRSLAEDLRISRTTAVLAYDQLAAEGVIRTRAGAGTFVADPLPADARAPRGRGGATCRIRRCRAAAPRWRPRRARRRSSVGRRGPSGSARRRSTASPCTPGRAWRCGA